MRTSITQQELQDAFYELSFNRWKVLKLFSFCFACCIVGLTALYWTLDITFEKRIDSLTNKLLQEMEKEVNNAQMPAVSSIYEGVAEFRGRADFDNVTVINPLTPKYIKDHSISRVHGERRAVAEGIYEVRFRKVTDEEIAE